MTLNCNCNCWSKHCGYPSNIILKNMFLVNFIVLKYNGKYPFLEHHLSVFCKTFCNHPFLKGYYIYFWRSLTDIHLCVNNVFQIIAVFLFVCLFVCFFLSRVICIYLFYNINCSHLSNQVNCDWFKSTKKVLCLLKETNCSSDFSVVPVYSAKLSAVSFI